MSVWPEKIVSLLFASEDESPTAIVEQTNLILGMLMAGHIITLKDGEYHSDVVINGHSTTINGKVIPSPDS